MGLQYQWMPIEQWPGQRTPNHARKSGKFKASFGKTLDVLERELGFLRAKNVVLQADVSPSDIRLDGMLYASSRPRSAGIVLSFESKHGPLSYPCDTYTDWQSNLRAIALGLEALRAVERYGVTRRGEQYQGWARLPGPESVNGFHSRADALNLLRQIIGGRVDALPVETALRECEVATHPDRGGNASVFNKVQQARNVLLGGK